MEISRIIKSAGLKATPQRRLVYEAMRKLGHATVDDVAASIKTEHMSINISTIYRVMESFCAVGLLSKMNHPDGKTYFDITTKEHHHIFDTSGNIIDFEDEELTALIKEKIKGEIGNGRAIKRISIQITTSEK